MQSHKYGLQLVFEMEGLYYIKKMLNFLSTSCIMDQLVYCISKIKFVEGSFS